MQLLNDNIVFSMESIISSHYVFTILNRSSSTTIDWQDAVLLYNECTVTLICLVMFSFVPNYNFLFSNSFLYWLYQLFLYKLFHIILFVIWNPDEITMYNSFYLDVNMLLFLHSKLLTWIGMYNDCCNLLDLAVDWPKASPCFTPYPVKTKPCTLFTQNIFFMNSI